MPIKDKDKKELLDYYEKKKICIKERLKDFEEVYKKGDDIDIFLELVFCIFTAGASARMGLRCVDVIKDMVMKASQEELLEKLRGKHLYPDARAGYIVHTRKYLIDSINFKLKEKINSFKDSFERRDFFAANPGIKGLGYKEGSHFLRNIGFKGYAILDKHIIRSLCEFGYLDNPKPPSTKKKYLLIEEILKQFAIDIGVDFDELDVLLWSRKTGEILK